MQLKKIAIRSHIVIFYLQNTSLHREKTPVIFAACEYATRIGIQCINYSASGFPIKVA